MLIRQRFSDQFGSTPLANLDGNNEYVRQGPREYPSGSAVFSGQKAGESNPGRKIYCLR